MILCFWESPPTSGSESDRGKGEGALARFDDNEDDENVESCDSAVEATNAAGVEVGKRAGRRALEVGFVLVNGGSKLAGSSSSVSLSRMTVWEVA